MGGSGESLMREAVKPLAPVEREKDAALLQQCIQQFATTMRRHIRCLHLS
jgi:hypothetical protein